MAKPPVYIWIVVIDFWGGKRWEPGSVVECRIQRNMEKMQAVTQALPDHQWLLI